MSINYLYNFFLVTLIISTTNFTIVLNGMENSTKNKQIRAHFFIGTCEYNNESCPPFSADQNNAIKTDLISQLYKNNTEHIFITYNLLTTLMQSYKEACGYFAAKNIKDPLQ